MALISITVSGQGDLQSFIRGLNEKTIVRPILDQTTAILLNRIRTRFLAESGPTGKWVPSEASRKRSRSGRGGGTLFDTGRLFRSIQLARQTKQDRVLSTDVPYAKYQQPFRPFIGMNEIDVADFEDISRRLVLNRIARSIR